MMLYSSLALMVWHWLPGVILAWLRRGLFAVYMATTAASRCASPSGRSTSDARGGCYPRFGKQARGAARAGRHRDVGATALPHRPASQANRATKKKEAKRATRQTSKEISKPTKPFSQTVYERARVRSSEIVMGRPAARPPRHACFRKRVSDPSRTERAQWTSP